jgi:signal transduction histidine kinase
VIPFAVGTRWPVESGSVAHTILATGAPARVNDYSDVRGEVAGVIQDEYPTACIVGAPIVVDGRVWGMIGVGTPYPGILPPDTESRLAAFTELVATAIANSEARLHLRTLADEQAALRRVATLVAKGATAAELFAGVADEVAHVIGVPMATMSHYEADRSFTVIGSANNTGFPVGSRWTLDGPSLAATIFETGRAARMDDYSKFPGEVAAAVRDSSIHAAVGAPILVEGRVWGHISVAAIRPEVLPADAEERLAGFAELVSTAVANGEARDDLRRLFAEQAALRRVATLVARGTSATDLFTAVAEEVAEIIGVSLVSVDRYDPDGHSTVLASVNNPFFPVGSRWPLDGPSVGATVLETGRPARVDDYSELQSTSAAAIRASSVRSTVGAPIVVDGTVWGVICVATREPVPLPRETEERLVRFTELVATAISNTTTRAELMASRARLVAAGDDARRRIERTLHDRTQQQLIALGLDLQAVRIAAPPELLGAHAGFDRLEQEIASVREEVRQLARGLHPALRARGGLGPSLRALARRLPIHVDFTIEVRKRLSEPVETCIYYVVSEALTNAIKHSKAARVAVTVTATDTSLRATVEDNGVGGAEIGGGSGLTGLIDRVEALGGRLTLHSPPGEGTRMAVDLPLGEATP